MPRPIALLFALGLIIGIAGALFFRAEPPPPTPEVVAPAPAPPPPPADIPAYDPANPEIREAAIRATRLPSEVSYPVQSKFRDVQHTSVPHELVGAYEEGARSPVLIFVVPPDTPSESLAQLVEDTRKKYIAAPALRLEVYDSKVAATHPLQAGVSEDPHRVATHSRKGANVTYELQGKPAPSPQDRGDRAR